MNDYYLSKTIAYDSMGIYPAAYNGVKRSEWQDGWNAYGNVLIQRAYMIQKWLQNHPKREQIIEMYEDGELFVRIDENDNVSISYNSSDIFEWGYSDEEEIKDEEFDEVYAAYKSWTYGLVEYHCKKYNREPQTALRRAMDEEARKTKRT